MTSDESQPLWTPSPARKANAGITRYLAWLKAHRELEFKDYESLWRWSIDEIESFYETLWQFGEVISHAPYRQVLDKRTMPGAKWFEGATLNYAEHALRFANDADASEQPAIIFQSEIVARAQISWSELKQEVGALAATLKALALKKAIALLRTCPTYRKPRWRCSLQSAKAQSGHARRQTWVR
jgi:acetoacetyl-CoA synthetase